MQRDLAEAPDTVEEVGVEVSYGPEAISDEAVQLRVTVLEVIEDAEDGAVVVVGGQGGQADVLQRHLLLLVVRHQPFDGQLQVQHLSGQGERVSQSAGTAAEMSQGILVRDLINTSNLDFLKHQYARFSLIHLVTKCETRNRSLLQPLAISQDDSEQIFFF